MRGFNVQEFRSVIDANRGILRNNKFLVEFPAPRKLQKILNIGSSSPNGNILSFYCKSAALPGLGILTSDVYRYGYGPIERFPYGTVFNDSMMSFYVDGNNMVRRWLRRWITLIVNIDSKNGMQTQDKNTGQMAYEYSYKQDYAVDIRVTVFDPEGYPIISVVLTESYPNYVGDVQMDWEDKNSNMHLPMSFTYKDWFEDSVDNNDMSQIYTAEAANQRVTNTLNIFNQASSIVGGLRSFI